MPEVEVVDLAEERRANRGEPRLISRRLEDALRKLKEKGEQAIIFLNRRGFNTIVHCGACDDVKKCPHCDVSLTFHRQERRLSCHYCDFQEPLYASCRSCGSKDVRPLGAGTERITDVISAMIPDLRLARLDRDVTQKAGALEATLTDFREGRADVLVGTQMVAKGHDFPKVTLVGIILADASLALPDFRAAERTFQLLTQVAGRAGRAERPGRVIVQTLQPDHYALQSALRHDVEAFTSVEFRMRQTLSYPPYCRLGVLRIESRDLEQAESAAHRAAEVAKTLPELRVLGPSPAAIAKIRDKHRFLILLFAATPAALCAKMTSIKHRIGSTGIIFDVDAFDLL